MILLRVRNGLGNQMFIYAFGEFLKHKTSIQIKYDFSDLPYEKYYNLKKIFQGDIEIASNEEIRRYGNKPLYMGLKHIQNTFLKRIVYRLNSFEKASDNIVIKEPIYYDIPNDFIRRIFELKIDKGNNYIFDGYWENMKYIDAVKSDVLKLFAFKNMVIKDELKKILRGSNTVSVHVRRGDYVLINQLPPPKTDYSYCDSAYYKRAIGLMNKNINSPVFIFFSDDIDFIASEFKWIKNKYIVTGYKDYEDLQLMALCKNHILANSTFSFWGAFLSKKEGITVAPKIHYRWIAEKYEKEIDFFRVSGWTYI